MPLKSLDIDLIPTYAEDVVPLEARVFTRDVDDKNRTTYYIFYNNITDSVMEMTSRGRPSEIDIVHMGPTFTIHSDGGVSVFTGAATKHRLRDESFIINIPGVRSVRIEQIDGGASANRRLYSSNAGEELADIPPYYRSV